MRLTFQPARCGYTLMQSNIKNIIFTGIHNVKTYTKNVKISNCSASILLFFMLHVGNRNYWLFCACPVQTSDYTGPTEFSVNAQHNKAVCLWDNKHLIYLLPREIVSFVFPIRISNNFHLLPGGIDCVYQKSRNHRSANHVWPVFTLAI